MGKYLDSLGLSHLIGLIKSALSGKQATLVSGTNIKTINNESLLGSGNISVGGGGSYLPLSGGTLTGELVIEDSEIDRSTTPSANQYHRLIELVDVNGNTVGYIQATHTTDGSVSFTLGTDNSDGTGQNQVLLGYSAGDGAFVVISHPAQWRSALGLGSLATKSSITAADIPSLDASKIGSGTLSLARGGTGVDGTDSGLNAGEFLASSPTAVNPMDVGFRRIVASDLPVVPAGKGGTGETSLNASANALINSLSTGASTNSDDDYIITQYAGGGTTTTTYHRRKISKLWDYIKGKADSVYAAISHTHVPTDVVANTSNGNYIDKNVSSNVSVASVSGTATTGGTTITTFTLNKGVWLVAGGVQFAANATGWRKVVVSTSSGTLSTSNGAGTAASCPACNAGTTRVQVAGIVIVTADNTSLYVIAGQSSGSAINALARFRAIRLAST